MKKALIAFAFQLSFLNLVWSQKTDTIKITFPEKEMPEWLINSSYDIKPYVTANKHNEAFAFLNESLQSVSGIIMTKAVKVSFDSRQVLEKENLLPSSVTIDAVQTDLKGDVWVTGTDFDNDKSEFSFSVLYHFNRNLELIRKHEMPSVHFPVSLNWDASGNMLLWTMADSILPLWDKKIVLKKQKSCDFQLSIIDPSLKTIKVIEMEGKSDVLNDAAMILTHPSGAMYVIQNTTILSGPDHHEVHLWYFADNKSKPMHKHLWGKGELEYLWVREAAILPDGSLSIKGYANDSINFGKDDVFFQSDSTRKTEEVAADDSESFWGATPGFGFSCVYSPKLQLQKYQFLETFPEFYSYMSAGFPGAGYISSPDGKKIFYRALSGAENTSESPVFEIAVEP